MEQAFLILGAIDHPDLLAGLFMAAVTGIFLLGLDLALFARTGRRVWLDSLAIVAAGAALLFFQVCDYYTGAGMNEAVWYHLRLGMTGLEWGQVAYLVERLLVVAAFAVTFFWLAAKSRRKTQNWRIAQCPRVAKLSLMAALLGSTMALAANPVSLQGTNQLLLLSQQEQLQKDLIAHSKPWPAEWDTTNKNPKSVVYIYAESMEATFLDETRFPGLTPNLQALREQAVSLDGLAQAPFTGWTIAGIIASQCGFPALGTQHHTKDVQSKNVDCLSDQLKTAGYELTYINGADIKFAGKDLFFEEHGFDTVLGRDEILQRRGQLPLSKWGVYDDDMFSVMIEELDRHLSSDTPFFLAALTVDTHPPAGHWGQWCEENAKPYGAGDNDMLNAIHCSDQLLGQVVAQVRAKTQGRAIVVVASDHLQSASSSLAADALRDGDTHRRNLWLALDTGRTDQRVSRAGTTFDVAPTLLGLMGWDVPAVRLGRDLLGPEPSLMEQMGRKPFFARVQSAFSRGENGRFVQTVSTPAKQSPATQP